MVPQCSKVYVRADCRVFLFFADFVFLYAKAVTGESNRSGEGGV